MWWPLVAGSLHGCPCRKRASAAYLPLVPEEPVIGDHRHAAARAPWHPAKVLARVGPGAGLARRVRHPDSPAAGRHPLRRCHSAPSAPSSVGPEDAPPPSSARPAQQAQHLRASLTAASLHRARGPASSPPGQAAAIAPHRHPRQPMATPWRKWQARGTSGTPIGAPHTTTSARLRPRPLALRPPRHQAPPHARPSGRAQPRQHPAPGLNTSCEICSLKPGQRGPPKWREAGPHTAPSAPRLQPLTPRCSLLHLPTWAWALGHPRRRARDGTHAARLAARPSLPHTADLSSGATTCPPRACAGVCQPSTQPITRARAGNRGHGASSRPQPCAWWAGQGRAWWAGQDPGMAWLVRSCRVGERTQHGPSQSDMRAPETESNTGPPTGLTRVLGG